MLPRQRLKETVYNLDGNLHEDCVLFFINHAGSNFICDLKIAIATKTASDFQTNFGIKELNSFSLAIEGVIFSQSKNGEILKKHLNILMLHRRI